MQIQLTVAYVEFGGNTGGGKYFYSYSPDIITVTDSNVDMDFVLSKATDPRFEIDTLISTDANSQFQNPTVKSNKRGVDVMNVNSHAQVTFVAVMVRDTQTGDLIPCDPQVLNVPD